MKKFFLPLIISFSFFLESVFVEIFPKDLYKSDQIIIPHFLIATILFTTIYVNKKHGLVYGFIFGLLFDIVYTEVVGIYLLLFPLVSYIVFWIMKVLQTNILLVSIVSIIGIVLLEIGSFGMNTLIGRADMSFISFTHIRLYPTIILNSIFILLISFPLKKYLHLYSEALRND